MPKNWKSLEDHVRGLAELRWNTQCSPEHIDGVDFDAVVRPSPDEIIIIEITTEQSLNKVRDDLNKIVPTKARLALTGMICRGFIVLEAEPTNSMAEAGRSAHVSVLSAAHFERDFFDFSSYDSLRRNLPFGSAIDSKTGDNDPRSFVSVGYAEAGGQAIFGVDELVTRLLRSQKVVLTGDFGTGKSRCVREVYESLSHKIREAGAFPIAVNLRDHWSSSNALEILAGHLGNIGLSSSIDNLVRLLNLGRLVLLLDGFDEIGAQSHDTRVNDRKALRKHAVRGLRDLITKSRAGVLVTGRSHFFDSDEEMLQSLGLTTSRAETLTVTSPDSFSVVEGEKYLQDLGINITLPIWLPRKPLVFQILVELEKAEISRLLSNPQGEFEFWGTFINAVCMRESRGVSHSISSQTIKFILLNLARKSRYSDLFLGRLSPRDIDESYETAVGTSPDHTGRQLLARMCTLGRIEPESPDRQFVDYNVVDVLRAECLISDAVFLDDNDLQKQWRQSLRFLGIVHAASLINTFDLDQPCFAYLRKFGTTSNTKRLGEIVAALSIFGTERVDFQGLVLVASELPVLNLSSKILANLTIRESIISVMALDNTPITSHDNLLIKDSLFTLAAGVSSLSGLPDWIQGSEVLEFDRVSNSSRIKESPVPPQQKLLLAILHKIFFQPGAGREEASLSKGGYGQKYSPKLVDSILKLLIRERIVDKFKGNDGWVYRPIRKHTERVSRIRSELTLSEDPIWKEAALLRA